MSDVERVLGWFDSGALLRPDVSAPGLLDLSRALAHLCGAEDIELSPHARTIAAAIGPAEHYVFVLVDGFGMHLAEGLPPDDVLRSRMVMELRTVFPSSTAPALTTLATGLAPAQHAVPGWWTYLPDADLTATILPFAERFTERSLAEHGVSPWTAFPAPTLAQRYRRICDWVSPKRISGSAYSRYSSGNSASYGYTSLKVAIEHIDARIRDAASPTYTYLYIPFVDKAEHDHGAVSRQAEKALAHVCGRMKLLIERLQGRGRIILTADHGQVTVQSSDRVILDRHDDLIAMLRIPPTCEPRASAFHVRPGMDEAFSSAFRRRFGGRFALLTTDEVDELRLFGAEPLTAETRARLGDYLAVSAGHDVVLYEPKAELRVMLGFHGGLTPDEMRIPLILA